MCSIHHEVVVAGPAALVPRSVDYLKNIGFLTIGVAPQAEKN
jgi:hypothetical protein